MSRRNWIGLTRVMIKEEWHGAREAWLPCLNSLIESGLVLDDLARGVAWAACADLSISHVTRLVQGFDQLPLDGVIAECGLARATRGCQTGSMVTRSRSATTEAT